MNDPIEGSLRETVATLRAEQLGLAHRVSKVEACVEGLPRAMEEKHRENRNSIHELRNGQQTIIDLVHRVDMKIAKMTGYAIGAGAVVALIAKFVDKLWK